MAGIDNNTILYLRGDSFNDLSLNPKNIVNGETVISDNAYYINLNKLPIKVDDVNFGDTWTIDFFAHKNGDISTTILSKGYYTAGVNGGFTLRIINPSSGRNGLELWTSNGATLSYPFQNTSIYFNDTFDHYAFTYDGTKMNIFINGKFIKSFTFSFNFNQNNSPLIIGRDGYVTSPDSICIKHFRLSDTVLYTQDFTPPTKPYNSININITNEDNNKIDFNISKLGQEVINKVEVLINGTLSKTYEDIGDLVYNIDNNLCCIGNNEITIRVTYDDNYTEEEILTHTYSIDNLPNSSKLKDVIDRYELLSNQTEKINKQLADILINKNVEVKEDEYKLGALIDKVDLLKKAERLYLYKEGNECIYITGGWMQYCPDSSNPGGVFAKCDTYIECGDDGAGFAYSGQRSTSPIDVTDYSKLYIDASSRDRHGSEVCIRSYICKQNNFDIRGDDSTVGFVESKAEGRQVLEIDLTNIAGLVYVHCNPWSGSYTSGRCIMQTYNIWLES